MGNWVGILSTIILVSTLVTLVFAVFAYIGSRRRSTTQSVARHSGAHEIPDHAQSPVLPDEFVLRIYDVPALQRSRRRVDGAGTQEVEGQQESDLPPERLPISASAFRSYQHQSTGTRPSAEQRGAGSEDASS